MLDERAARASSPLILARPWGGRVLGSAREAAVAVPAAVWVAAIVVVSAIVRFLLAGASPAPWVIPDELIYSELGKSLARSGRFLVRGEPFSVWSFGPLYPILLAPAYRLAGTVPQAYEIVKAVNCVLFSSAAIPGYLFARRLVRPGAAVAAAGFAVILPAGIYTTKIMTESLSYPLFLWAILALQSALERPSIRRQLLALAAIGLAALARAQLAVLLPAFAGAIVVFSVLAPDRAEADEARRSLSRRLGDFRVTWAAFGVLAVAPAAFMVVTGSGLTGAHELRFGDLELGRTALSMLHHLAALDLYVGVIPLAAFVLVARAALARGERDRPLVAFVVVALAVLAGLLVSAAAYLTTLGDGTYVYDRYVFYAAPLLVVATLVWIEHGLPRPRGWTLGAAVLACGLPAVIPYDQLLTGREWGVSSSSVALVPWVGVRYIVGSQLALVGVVTLLCVAFVRIFVRVRPGRTALVTTALAAYFVGIAFATYVRNEMVSETVQGYGVAADPAWIDAAVGPRGKVIAIWSGLKRRGEQGAYAIWENDLFSRSVGRTYHLQEPLPYDPPGTKLRRDGRRLLTGSGRPLDADYVLTDVTVPLAARRVAADRRTGLVLYDVGGRVLLRPTGS